MSFDQLPADPKNAVNERYANTSGQYHGADSRYQINSMDRHTNAAIDGGTAWDPYEALTLNVRKGSAQLLPDDGEDYATKGSKELHKLGFLTPELSGFDQEAPNHDGGFWHGLKHLFVKDDSNGDKVRDHVMKAMAHDPIEQKQYDQEEKDLKAYRSRMLAWETQANMNPGNPPSPPDCPMHEEVERRVQQEEKQIAAQVERNMSPQDRDRLHKQMDEYEQACTDRFKNENPMGTGGGMRTMPEPGNAIRDYYDRIGEATEKYCNS